MSLLLQAPDGVAPRMSNGATLVYSDTYAALPALYNMGQALDLNGTNQNARNTTLAGQPMPSQYTVRVLCRPLRAPAGGVGDILFNNSFSTANRFDFRFVNNAGSTTTTLAQINFFNSAEALQSTNLLIVNLNALCDLLVTRNGNEFRFYQAGAFVTTKTFTPSSAGTTFSTTTTGASHGTLLGLVLGVRGNVHIIEVDFINGLLSDADIAAMWNSGLPTTYRDTTLAAVPSVFRWKLDGNGDDSSGNGHSLTMVNSPTYSAA